MDQATDSSGTAGRAMKYSWADMPREQVRPGVTRAGFRGDGALMVMNWLEPGMEVRPHSHPFDQMIFIVQGRIKFTVGDEVIVLGPGEVLRIPGDVVHCGEPIGTETVMNLDVFAPVRDDYRHLTTYQEGDFAPQVDGAGAA